MKTTLHTEWTVADVCKGFTYNELLNTSAITSTMTANGMWRSSNLC